MYNTFPNPYNGQFTPHNPEMAMLREKLERLEWTHLQLLNSIEFIKNQLMNVTGGNSWNGFTGYNGYNGLNGFNNTHGLNGPFRAGHFSGHNHTQYAKVRESESHVFFDLYIPGLTMSDLEVETYGNKLVCRTRVPVATHLKWWSHNNLPHHDLTINELGDGRCEFSWTVPVSFEGTTIEAGWKDGWVSFFIPKKGHAEIHKIKLVGGFTGESRMNGVKNTNGKSHAVSA